MNKKKITSSLLAVALVSSLAIGSLAWFTSQDSVKNQFSTGTTNTDDSRVDAGIKIDETFDKTAAQNVLPGQTVQKLVKVHSTANYDQLVRTNITKQFTYNGKVVDMYAKTVTTVQNDQGQDVPAETITFYNSKTDENIPSDAVKLDINLIELNLTANSNWLDNTKAGGFYYYNEVLPAGQDTKALLDSVTLNKTAGNEYKNLGFDVVVNAESIQASNGAASDAWQGAPDSVLKLGGTLANN